MPEIRVITMNIQGWLGAFGLPDPDNIAAVVGPNDPDLVFVTEAWWGPDRGGDQPARIAERLGLPFRAYGGQVGKGNGTFGDAILSRYELTDVKTTVAPRPPFWWLPWNWSDPLGWVSASCAFPGLSLHVIATHISWKDYYAAPHIQELARFIAALSDGRPILLGGDMNEPWHTELIAPLRGVIDYLGPRDSDFIDHLWCQRRGYTSTVQDYRLLPVPDDLGGAGDHGSYPFARIEIAAPPQPPPWVNGGEQFFGTGNRIRWEVTPEIAAPGNVDFHLQLGMGVATGSLAEKVVQVEGAHDVLGRLRAGGGRRADSGSFDATSLAGGRISLLDSMSPGPLLQLAPLDLLPERARVSVRWEA
jgi:endonuclease/exonuclease/phosphatase family metal-dependent hydrolase